MEQDRPGTTPSDQAGVAAQRLAAHLREKEPPDEEPPDEEPPDEEPPHEEPPHEEPPDEGPPTQEPAEGPLDEEPSGDQTFSGPDRVPSAARGVSAPDLVPVPASVWASICPYLLDASGTWRAAQPSRDHRCTAVAPAEPLRAEKQRRLCLGAGHLDCPLFLAAREDRARNLGEVASVPPGRPFARTVPVILQRPAAVAVVLSTVRTSLPQVGLLILMLLGAAALILARFVTP